MAAVKKKPHVVIIGAGFSGLAAGYELCRRGIGVTLLEKDAEIGGLAGSFQVDGRRLEKFYHHWFSHDTHIMSLINELSLHENVILRPTRTGMYYGKKLYRLSSPVDLIGFKPLSVRDRIRLSLLALSAHRVKDWRDLENVSATEWLKQMAGDNVYAVVWEPLLRGKFGEFAKDVSAAWFWNKLKLRGGSRGKGGDERLAYYRGGFAELADEIASFIISAGGNVLTGNPVTGLRVASGRVIGVESTSRDYDADAVIATPALPIIADLVEPYVSAAYTATLRAVKYLANVCLVLELHRSLSDLYWINVNDLDFPFVAVIEHTNFEPKENYNGRVIVYLSKYLDESADLYRMADSELLNYAIPHIRTMFPDFDPDWIINHHVWRARYSQPVVVRRYSNFIVPHQTPLEGFFIATMAQIYPEDRGTNFAVRDGRKVGGLAARYVGEGT